MKTFWLKSKNHWSKSTLNVIEQWIPIDLEETFNWLKLEFLV